jgi:hypothetical protein
MANREPWEFKNFDLPKVNDMTHQGHRVIPIAV